ncbi:MAG: squalene/phytoene synthase family protein [Pseudomonadota bacterium]
MSRPNDPCADLIRDADPDRWSTARLAGPRATRLTALYAFNLEVARIPSVVSEPTLGEIRLQWWRDAIQEIFDGKPPRRHEIVEPLAAAIRDAALPQDHFEALLDARSYDLAGPAFGDAPLLQAYLDGTSGRLMQLAALALDATPEEAAAARRFGRGAGLGALIRALPALYARGADPIPTPEPLDRNALAEGRTPQALRDTLRPLAEAALQDLAEARKTRLRPEIRPAVLAGWRAEEALRAAARPGFDLYRGLPEPSEFRRRGGLAWRVLRDRW